MILSTYSQFRRHFAASGAAVAADGLPEWPGPVLDGGTGEVENASTTSLLRVNGFTATLQVTTAGGLVFPASTVGPLVDPARIPTGDAGFPLSLTCNAGAVDAVTGAHDYDWFVSQRREEGRYPTLGSLSLTTWAAQALTVSMPDRTKSGTISITTSAAVAVLLPGLSGSGLLTTGAFTTLFRHVHVYCRRRSDGAVQWARMYVD